MKASFAFRSVALASALAGSFFAGGAAAQQVVLKVHHFLPATSSAQVRLIQPWCDKIAKESADRLKCQIYPSMQLGGTPAQLFDQARDGVADIVWTVPTYAAGRFNKASVFELPWMAVSAKAASQAYWTYVHKYAMDEFKGVQLLWMHMHDGALFHFIDKKPKSLEDMKGMKIRAATRSNAHMLTALGATPVQMPLPGVPDALSKGIVDGAAVPWEGTPAVKLTEIAKYHLDVPVGSPRISNTIFAFAMNQAKYDSLTPEQKKVIDANSGVDFSAAIGKAWDESAPAARKQAQDRGNQFNTIGAAEVEGFQKATARVAQDWVKEVTKKGYDGKAMLHDAETLSAKYAK